MPSYLTSSRIRKPGSAAPLRRHSTTPFSAAQRTRPLVQRSESLADALKGEADNDDEEGAPHLEVKAVSAQPTPTPTVTFADLASAIHHATSTMFCSIPERAGMNSTRIAEVLNYQKHTPHVVSLAHVHALLATSSKTERLINEGISAGTVRKIRILGRGNSISGLSELLILTSSLRTLLTASNLPQPIITSFLDLLAAHPRAILLPPNHRLPPVHLRTLTRAGFLVSASAYLNATNAEVITRSAIVSTAAIARATSGTLSAVGGAAAFEELGGAGHAKRSDSANNNEADVAQLMLSVPGIGSYIRLLTSARAHLLHLLSQSPYSECPVSLLKERWEGAVDNEGHTSKARNVRGVFSEVMPARTKKWRKFWGLRFEWVLEECVGAGEVEKFETGAVGWGVRAVGQ